MSEFHWTELRGRVRGLVNTARAAEVVVRAEQSVEVAEFQTPDTRTTRDIALVDPFRGLVRIPVYESYEDAVFSEDADGGESTSPSWLLERLDRINIDVARDELRVHPGLIADEDIIEAQSILEVWDAPCE